jgi:O-antigen biosynthesis protein WbqP
MHQGTKSLPTHEVGEKAITKAGRTLRRLKLDELPQLWNVLKGEMSLVGPRPCLPTQGELIERRRELGVYALRPGITGLAQVRGIDMSDPNKCAAADAEYLKHRSLRLDAEIILKTLGGRKSLP